jgi:hypothetical protein
VLIRIDRLICDDTPRLNPATYGNSTSMALLAFTGIQLPGCLGKAACLENLGKGWDGKSDELLCRGDVVSVHRISNLNPDDGQFSHGAPDLAIWGTGSSFYYTFFSSNTI